MPTENKYDYIIIGAGCAGLSLAYRLLNKNYRICILESNRNVNVINKLWSFWDTKKTPFNHLIKKRWKSLTITNDTESIKINCGDYNYQSINSNDFNNYIVNKINKNKNIDLKFSEKVENIKKNNDEIIITTIKNIYKCKHVFDSSPKINKVFMWQQFFGAYVKAEEEIFDESSPIFMEFSDKKNKFHFMYVLPFSKKTALVESTYFSCDIEKEMLGQNYINAYMNKKHANKKYLVEKTEYGKIPMDTKIDSISKDYITKIGTYSGVTRASTGYTFINIQKQSDKLVKTIPIINNKKKNKKYFHSFLLRKMDSVFIKIISNDPEYMKNALMDLFRTKNHNSQIRFLSDTPTILDIIKIIIYLPKIKFMKYALGLKKEK